MNRIEALRKALEADPDNQVLRLMLAELLTVEQDDQGALTELLTLLGKGELPTDKFIFTGMLALKLGQVEQAQLCLEQAQNLGLSQGIAELQAGIDQKLGITRANTINIANTQSSMLQFEPIITFTDVGGLTEVKKILERLIILPFKRPELYSRFGKKAGGGVLLYGPPGCGKTLLARAIAGECQLPFFAVRIEQILDPYIGMSERNLHAAFEQARQNSPCVVFIDELDAVAFPRRRQPNNYGRALVDQLLQELDAIGYNNHGILFMAATNAPWDIDDAMLRPGRLDRRVFVPPPDETARLEILKIHLDTLPTEDIDLIKLSKQSRLFSGADLRALISQGVELAIEETIDLGSDVPLKMTHLQQTLAKLHPTTIDWLESAKNYIEFANQDGRYNDIQTFLNSAEAKISK